MSIEFVNLWALWIIYICRIFEIENKHKYFPFQKIDFLDVLTFIKIVSIYDT